MGNFAFKSFSFDKKFHPSKANLLINSLNIKEMGLKNIKEL